MYDPFFSVKTVKCFYFDIAIFMVTYMFLYLILAHTELNSMKNVTVASRYYCYLQIFFFLI